MAALVCPTDAISIVNTLENSGVKRKSTSIFSVINSILDWADSDSSADDWYD